MTLEEIRKLKAELTKNVMNLVVDFEDKTGCIVPTIEFLHIDASTFGGAGGDIILQEIIIDVRI